MGLIFGEIGSIEGLGEKASKEGGVESGVLDAQCDTYMACLMITKSRLNGCHQLVAFTVLLGFKRSTPASA